MEEIVLQHGYDGAWFLRAYDFFGNKVGSKGIDLRPVAERLALQNSRS